MAKGARFCRQMISSRMHVHMQQFINKLNDVFRVSLILVYKTTDEYEDCQISFF